jgi:hypothetical protein
MKNSSLKAFAALTLGAVLLSSSASAQSKESGLLGKRHAGIDLSYGDFTGSRIDDSQGVAVEANTPITPKFDFTVRHEYAYASGNNYGLSSNALSASVLTYNRTEYGKAYFGGGIGHAWDRVKVSGIATRETGAIWSVRAGYEVPVDDRTAINAGLIFTDAFNGASVRNPTLSFRIEGNHWFANNVAGVISAAYQQVKQMPDSSLFSVGLRWTF